MKKTPIIELLEYNFLMSLLDYFNKEFNGVTIHGKPINIVQSYSDVHNRYKSPALTVEILHRKNRETGFSSYLGEQYLDDHVLDFEGTIMEYRVQLNVYSNTRGEIHKWCSILDEVLKNGESGIDLNTYLDNGSIKQEKVGIIDYSYGSDVTNNNLAPNIVTYDFHTIYEVKMRAIQKYKIHYEYMEIGDIIGTLKSLRGDY